ncbi:MAG TPA: hypothetical protein VF669_17840 [Tepidisphaeraceae bacterium]|jgi:hypothetical protein
MKTYIKKNQPLFFDATDENDLDSRLIDLGRDTCWIDGALWPSEVPPTRSSLAECQSRIVYLWNSRVIPALPHKILPDGRIQGPTSGVVIQHLRCTRVDRLLISGDIGIGYDAEDTDLGRFVTSVWRILRQMKDGALVVVDAEGQQIHDAVVKDYVVGSGARARSQEGWLLKHCAVDVYYRTVN